MTIVLAFLALACGEGRERHPTSEAMPTIQDAAKDRSVRLLYVPAYAYAVDQSGRTTLATTLTVHNTTFENVTVHSVDYYDSAGILVQKQLDAPRELGPLEAIEFHQEAKGPSEGAGANFLVGWTGPTGSSPPLAEALMVGHQGAGRLTFTSRGVEVGMRSAGKPASAVVEEEP